MMMSEKHLDELKCSRCNKYLTYFPIYVSEGCTAVCGRCPQPTESNFVRDIMYEKLAENCKFPCIYQKEGCVEFLKPLDVPKHEQTCYHRIIHCPVHSNCVWIGTFRDVVDHCQEQHPASFLKEGEFEIDLLGSYGMSNILMHNEEFFMLQRQFDASTNMFSCKVFHYDSGEPLSYILTLMNGTRTTSMKVPSEQDEEDSKASVKISVDSIKDLLDDPSIIIAKVRITSQSISVTEPQGNKNSHPPLNNDMLREMECPVCFTCMVPPIYQCVRGHSICKKCKADVKCCPTCQEDIKGTQNFNLEKLAGYLHYPCIFSEFGCKFVAKPDKIEAHQNFCSHGPYTCPIKDYVECKWRDTYDKVYKHVVDNHHDHYTDVDVITVFIDGDYFDSEDSFCYILKFEERLFKLHFLYKQHTFFWAMQLLGPPEDCQKYGFELDITNSTKMTSRILLRAHCAPVADADNSFGPEDSVYLNYDQVEAFITDTFVYKVRVLKT